MTEISIEDFFTHLADVMNRRDILDIVRIFSDPLVIREGDMIEILDGEKDLVRYFTQIFADLDSHRVSQIHCFVQKEESLAAGNWAVQIEYRTLAGELIMTQQRWLYHLQTQESGAMIILYRSRLT